MRRSDSPPRWMPPKSRRKSKGAADENANARNGFSRRHRARRDGVGLYLYVSFRRKEGGEPPRCGGKGGADGAQCRQGSALTPRTGRNFAQGSRDAAPEGKQGAAEQPPDAGWPGLDGAEIHG